MPSDTTPLIRDADATAGAAGLWARRHRDTPTLGMTLLQPEEESSKHQEDG